MIFWPTKTECAQSCEIPTNRCRTASDRVLALQKAIKQKFESEDGEEQNLEDEFKIEFFRTAEVVLFRKISNDVKYTLDLRLRLHSIPGQVFVAEYPVDINP